MERYSIVSSIGCGTYGQVFKAFNKVTGETVSAKSWQNLLTYTTVVLFDTCNVLIKLLLFMNTGGCEMFEEKGLFVERVHGPSRN